MKNIWCSKIKEEMLDQVKTIDFIYEKEVLSKTYEFKLEYLFNYRNLLTLYNANTNVIGLIKVQIQESYTNPEFVKLLNLFFDFVSLNEAQYLLLAEDIDGLVLFLSNEVNSNTYKTKFQEMIDVEHFHEKNESQLIQFRENFNSVSKFEIESISEGSRLIYALMQGLVEFEILKHDIHSLKRKKKELIKKIQITTNEWPKKKKFFERAYKLLLYSKTSSNEIKEMTYLFEQMKVAHPLIEYNDEALKLVLNLKEKFHKQNTAFDKAQVDEMVFDNISARRIVLTKKLLVLESFNAIFRKSLVKESLENKESAEASLDSSDVKSLYNKKLDSFKFVIEGNAFNLKELLWTLKFSVKLYNDDIDTASLLKTKKYLDQNFDFDNYCIKDSSNQISSIQDNQEISAEVNKDKAHDCSSCENNLPIKSTETNTFINLEVSNCYEGLTSENVVNISIDKTKTETSNNQYKEKLQVQQNEVKILQDQKSRLEDQKYKAESILGLLKQFVRMKDFYTNNKSLCSFYLDFIKRVNDGEKSFNDVEFIRDIVIFFVNKEENIVTGEYCDFEEYNISSEGTENLSPVEIQNLKIKYIDEAFAQMEAELYYQIQEVLNDNTDNADN
eukprot:CAMPEP_0170527818 /NCGR_PEP_ID=MMETSP0209-20121228/13299_1 /TAXON_ID=665100 ORGANISM="Litonotus pictus, Strain P1" /NCGR_SAMPLE_ID=MMETSP0209 /ASSEMBLY_ACC=CAM_ASM_000301 /LENGTH=614 /DNA_ID=CAMNT_0010818613 /DNA_START=98 /DNA_END=1942 /DNA_ORIENTATION=+